MFLFSIIANKIYNKHIAFNLAGELYEINKIYLVREWTPFAENVYREIEVDSETEKKILELITSPVYYRRNIHGYYGEIKVIEIHIESFNHTGNKVYYNYYISNTGQIEIKNVDKGKGSFYSLGQVQLFLYDNQKDDIKKLYNQLIQLISINEGAVGRM